ncbi:hypothetical protein BO79DRAFT_79383 [Aspergillus costaricaensis CBS 115574]|uniref:Uncharacterized protein n=1 Tax=Aspergillus costaricaensis CBS 115574 TaxID=1448317 RepID=A0ACD1ILC9_9EURO|nr:hypothetical protein BO79DRAFT_79383 [Aspergillus costaricaensis CBS 115574]RAK91162.1 hypothetical protein BO79DRAFT_79383 [Aspergillus costaricaensis CBS 115574]
MPFLQHWSIDSHSAAGYPQRSPIVHAGIHIVVAPYPRRRAAPRLRLDRGSGTWRGFRTVFLPLRHPRLLSSTFFPQFFFSLSLLIFLSFLFLSSLHSSSLRLSLSPSLSLLDN